MGSDKSSESSTSTPAVPPRPLDDADGPPPVDVPAPWMALAWGCLLALVAMVAAQPRLLPLALSGQWSLLPRYTGAPALAAATVLLLVLAAVVADRAAPSWSLPVRWAVAMAVARGLPLMAVLALLGSPLGQVPWPLARSFWQIPWGIAAGAGLGLALGLAARRRGSPLGRVLLAGLAYEICFFYAYCIAATVILGLIATPSHSMYAVHWTWAMLSLRHGCPVGLATAAALAFPLALAWRRLSSPGSAPSSPRKRPLMRRLAPLAVVIITGLPAVYIGAVHARRQALFTAAATGDVGRVERLLDQGVDPDRFDIDSFSLPLHRAVRLNQLPTVELLLERGADPNATDRRSGRTALHGAVSKSRVAGGKLLISFGADPNFPARSDGRTPLHDAAHHPESAMVEALLTRGADPQAVDMAGETPLDMAERISPMHPSTKVLRKATESP